jgi:hypothetical protein
MTAGSTDADGWWRVSRIVVVCLVLLAALSAALSRTVHADDAGLGPTVGERIALLAAERAALQARAGGEDRLVLLPAFRAASSLTDAVIARTNADTALSVDDLPASQRQAVEALDGLNGALRDVLERPGEGSAQAVAAHVERANAELERLAGLDDAPVVLSYTPRFVPPRRTTGELTLVPGRSGAALPAEALRSQPLPGLSVGAPPATQPTPPSPPQVPTVPRYAPDFAVSGDEEPAVEVAVAGARMTAAGERPPVLSVGGWRGVGAVAPNRLVFTVPRAAFATDAARSTFAAGTLSIRRGPRVAVFQLVFTVLPDRPGAFALDQRVVTTETESNTLVSPEILARAAVGETRTMRRCFDPPAGWRFDAQRRRVIIVERLGWLDDVTDPSQNSGSVEFVAPQEPGQICVAVIARPVSKAARTATIGRFEATLVRDKSTERVTKSGVRALDWQEAVRIPLETDVTEWKLYVRLFGEIDREFDATSQPHVPFLHIVRDGEALVLRADQSAEP